MTLRLVALAQKQHIFKVKFKPEALLQMDGMAGFHALGADGKDAVPELIRMYEQDHAVKNRYLATEALGGIGPAAEQAVPMLVQSLGDTNSEFRFYAIGGLGRIHSRPDIALPALVKCLSGQELGVRRVAADAIRDFGIDARPAVPALLKLLADSKGKVREAADEALKQIDPEALAKAGVK